MIVPVLYIVWFLRINDHIYGKGNFHPGFLQVEKEKIFKTGYDEGTCHGLFLAKSEARDKFIHALKLGNDEKYVEMNQYFAEIVISQRLEILRARIKTYIEEPEQAGQLTLQSFISV